MVLAGTNANDTYQLFCLSLTLIDGDAGMKQVYQGSKFLCFHIQKKTASFIFFKYTWKKKENINNILPLETTSRSHRLQRKLRKIIETRRRFHIRK